MSIRNRCVLQIVPLALAIFAIIAAPAYGRGVFDGKNTGAGRDARELEAGTISGTVIDEYGAPVSFALVRIQTTRNQAITDPRGRFRLTDLTEGRVFTVSAWKDGYYCGKAAGISPPASGVELIVRLYQTTDNTNYEWMPPEGDESCMDCKPDLTRHWLDNDAHAGSAENPRFLTMYEGADVNGNLSPETRYVNIQDYGEIPLKPDDNRPYYGPGYRLDFPDHTGNCSACHVPGAAVDAPYDTNPAAVYGADRYGVHCDFCHKVADVRMNPSDGLPYPNMPGVLSMEIRRPFTGDPERFQLFFGSFDDDNVPEEDTRLPLIEESRFCAACHYGVFWDTVIYNSYGEWLESPYSNPDEGRTCQECHMRSPLMYQGTPLTNVARGHGGVERDPMTIHSHAFPGAKDIDLLTNSLTMNVGTTVDGDRLSVSVELINDKTGHHIPTDSPLRHMILHITATGPDGRPLELIDGAILPDWCGSESGKEGHYSGDPGKAYAKVLEELWTEISPSGAYWNPTRIISDNRLAAFGTDSSRYVFHAPEAGGRVSVTLLYRRAYIELVEQKGWQLEDIVMEEWGGEF